MTLRVEGLREVFWICGMRTPFLRSGTSFRDLTSYDLARHAISGLISESGIDPSNIEYTILGTVLSNVSNSNVARDAALAAGLPEATPAHTVSQACISANRAIATGADLIRTRQVEVVLAGGTECLSDIPIRFRKPLRRKMLEARKYRKWLDYLAFFRGLRPSHLLPEIPAIAEFSTGLSMGEDCERLASRYGVTREEQDEYAVRSHHLAAQAWKEGHLDQEVMALRLPPRFDSIRRDNGIRGDTSRQQLARLRPAFVKPYGDVTAGNSSFLSDGAAVALMASRSACERLGYPPRIAIRDWVFTGQPPRDALLLGPAFAVPKILQRNGLRLEEIEVVEFHEAFAGQVVANLKCLADPGFHRERLGRDEASGQIEPERLNPWGGSLSLGHPFGATGCRLLNTTAHRLLSQPARWGLIASCAAGGLGNAMLLERVG